MPSQCCTRFLLYLGPESVHIDQEWEKKQDYNDDSKRDPAYPQVALEARRLLLVLRPKKDGNPFCPLSDHKRQYFMRSNGRQLAKLVAKAFLKRK
jgi:hypothetical protein